MQNMHSPLCSIGHAHLWSCSCPVPAENILARRKTQNSTYSIYRMCIALGTIIKLKKIIVSHAPTTLKGNWLWELETIISEEMYPSYSWRHWQANDLIQSKARVQRITGWAVRPSQAAKTRSSDSWRGEDGCLSQSLQPLPAFASLVLSRLSNTSQSGQSPAVPSARSNVNFFWNSLKGTPRNTLCQLSGFPYLAQMVRTLPTTPHITGPGVFTVSHDAVCALLHPSLSQPALSCGVELHSYCSIYTMEAAWFFGEMQPQKPCTFTSTCFVGWHITNRFQRKRMRG